MAYWLLKTEPSDFSFDDLVKAKRAVWDGVANNTALIHIRRVKKGDLAIIYHTGDEKAAVGIAEVVTDAYPDPRAADSKVVVFDLKPKQRLAKPVTLKQIKADPLFAEWELVRISRLSVMPVPTAIWKRINQLSED
ncbi:MAG: EVE domain-containing protein [Burkholderiales bacterium]|nr:EVE domain-containing protein [Phycisphaerae bacterium]